MTLQRVQSPKSPRGVSFLCTIGLLPAGTTADQSYLSTCRLADRAFVKCDHDQHVVNVIHIAAFSALNSNFLHFAPLQAGGMITICSSDWPLSKSTDHENRLELIRNEAVFRRISHTIADRAGFRIIAKARCRVLKSRCTSLVPGAS